MKNLNLHKSILACLIAFSLSSYIFLNSTDVNASQNLPSAIEMKDADQKTNQEVVLPDVKVIKAIIQKGIDVLPAS